MAGGGSKQKTLRAMPLALAVILLGLLPTTTQAAPGDTDTSFGTGGVVVSDLGAEDYAREVVTDSDGRVVVVGRIESNNQTESVALVARYTTAGALDPTFGGGDGIASLHFGTGSFDHLAGVAIDGSGRIVVAGSTESDISCASYCHPVIARLTSSGQLDPTFAGDGILTIGAEEGGAWSVVFDDSGRIVVGTDLAVYRLGESGSLDPSFGSGGKASLFLGAFSGIAIDGAGRIVAANDFVVERLLSNGQVDESFGDEGIANPDIAPGSSDFIYSVVVDASNQIAVGGISFLPESEINGQPFILRYTRAGELDPSFSGDGLVLGSEEGLITDLTVDHAGRYLAIGYSNELDAGSNVLIRYLPDGSLDPAFGGGSGFADVPFFVNDIAVDPSQRILVSGVGGSEIDFAVARYLGDLTPSPSPPPPPPSPSPGPALTALPTTSTGPAPNPSSSNPVKRRKCRKGFVKRKIRGKVGCVKRKRRRSSS